MQGTVEARKAGATVWLPAELNEAYCTDETIRLGEKSRAAFRLRKEGLLRLDEHFLVSFNEQNRPEDGFWINQLHGAADFFSWTPRGLTIETPFVNAMIKRTELFVTVAEGKTVITVFEGAVVVSNTAGRLDESRGQLRP